MKQYGIVGLGNFGATVARELANGHFQVLALDNNAARIQDLKDVVHTAVHADATDRHVLEQMNVPAFECWVVSAGEAVSAATLICLHLQELGAKRIIVKAINEDQARVLRKVGATDVLIPEKDMARKIARSLMQPSVIDFLPLSGDYVVAEVAAPARFTGKKLMDVGLQSEFHVQVIAIKQGATDAITYAPGGQYQVGSGDVLVVLGREKDIATLARHD